eukprot:TRINITY_DN22223_c0_g1_i1.p1 TRINITY_DN22223_c0_g1~~TRINITY_DN22223_c0_g1_i1.p1  ORF type:complete len:787 (+),score=254.68 TRINITY_DN22223_c0_g1_i1:33-2363(+)
MSVVKELLSVCVGLANRAAVIIRDVQRDRENGVALKAELKDANDDRTYLTCADQRGQKVIVDELRARYPELTLVGEEDDDDSVLGDWKPPAFEQLDLTVCDSFFTAEGLKLYETVTLDELCVFIDPVDGTREFVEGRLEACQVLIGIALRGRPIAGVMHLPFHNQVGSTPTPYPAATGCVVYGAVGVGLAGLPPRQQQDKLIIASSAGCKSTTLAAVREVINAEPLHVGACGNKVLRLLKGDADVALFNLACSLWDTCATQALVVAQGGKLTTLHGNPIEHRPTGCTANRFGVIVTSAEYPRLASMTHQELCSKINVLPEVAKLLLPLGIPAGEQQAVDIIRDISGHYYTAEDFSKMLCGKKGVITAYSIREAEAIRYKQSYAARVRFTSNGDAPKSLFYKRVVLRDMPYAVSKAEKFPFKLVRDVMSCKVEAKFLASECPRLLSEVPGVSVVTAYRVEQSVCDSRPIDSCFGVLLHDYSKEDGWEQFPTGHEARQIRAQLRALAYFHGFFWLGERTEGCADRHAAMKEALLGDLWPTASYWDMVKQPRTQVENLPLMWRKVVERFEGEFRKEDQAPDVGERLAKVAEQLNSMTHGVDKEGAVDGGVKEHFDRYKTVIHGDTKAANFLFKEVGGDLPDVGVIDFQWTGVGLPGTDLAYSIAASVAPGLVYPLEGETDSILVKYYHECLIDAFVHYGVAPTKQAACDIFPLDVLVTQYERAFLDLARTVICDHWSTITPDILRQREASPTGYNMYNKNLQVAVWLASRITCYVNKHA